jgi:hypothetical protein
MKVKKLEENIMELMILIARIILLILEGESSTTAVKKVAEESGESFSRLWSKLHDRFK